MSTCDSEYDDEDLEAPPKKRTKRNESDVIIVVSDSETENPVEELSESSPDPLPLLNTKTTEKPVRVARGTGMALYLHMLTCR
jgi:hypothetical protein